MLVAIILSYGYEELSNSLRGAHCDTYREYAGFGVGPHMQFIIFSVTSSWRFALPYRTSSSSSHRLMPAMPWCASGCTGELPASPQKDCNSSSLRTSNGCIDRSICPMVNLGFEVRVIQYRKKVKFHDSLMKYYKHLKSTITYEN